MRTLARLAVPALALFTAPVHADVFVVDDDGGPNVDFTDLPPAIAGTAAGDVLLVRAGSYSTFTLQTGRAILGDAGAIVHAATVSNLPPQQRVILAGLELRETLWVIQCDGPVILDELDFSVPAPAVDRVWINKCLDARLHRSRIRSWSTSFPALRISLSRAEVVECTILGRDGDDEGCAPPGDGGNAMVVTNSRVHVALPDVLAGKGGDNDATCISFCGYVSGTGGTGLLTSGSEVIVAGRATDRIEGGHMGIGETCECDGSGGIGADLTNGTYFRYRTEIPRGGVEWCSAGGPAVVAGGGSVTDVPAEVDPSLQLTGHAGAGGNPRLVIVGAPGASARLYVGRQPVVVDTGAQHRIERLTSEERVVDLGALPASGTLQMPLRFPFHLPVGTGKGDALFAQVSVVNPDGTTQRTNSVPLVIR